MDAKMYVWSLVVAVCVLSSFAAADKVCWGLGPKEFINGNNIASFAGCTVIDGNLEINENSFSGNDYSRYTTITPDQLYVLEDVRQITGHVVIQGKHEQFTTLRFLRNLEIIQGATLSDVGAALQIFATSLETLELKSLERIAAGLVLIGHNQDLCFVNEINWSSLFRSSDQMTSIKFNKEPSQCEIEESVCDDECSDDGCWGTGDYNCLSCARVEYEGRCMPTCYSDWGLYPVSGTNSGQCGRCHELCDRCYGPGAHECTECKNFRDNGRCVPRCSDKQYVDYQNECNDCHPQCKDGCTADGADDCFECRAYMDGTVCVDECPFNKYLDSYGMCQFCHSECLGGCTGPSNRECTNCKLLENDGACVTECPSDKYADDLGQCRSCDGQCALGCSGPGPARCTSCRNFRDGSRCVSRCPDGTCSDENNACGPCRELPAMPTYEELVLEVNMLKDQAQQLTTYNNLPLVSFTAFSQPERMDYYAGDSLIFDGIITNIGGGYDPKTSIFTCPRSGVYMFTLSIDNYMRGSLVPSLYKEREMIASAGQYNSASQTVIIECDAGETIHVKTAQSGTLFNMNGWRTNSFTGFMLAHKVIGQ